LPPCPALVNVFNAETHKLQTLVYLRHGNHITVGNEALESNANLLEFLTKTDKTHENLFHYCHKDTTKTFWLIFIGTRYSNYHKTQLSSFTR